MSAKTIAMKYLDRRKIPYEIHRYPDSERDAVVIADILDAHPSQVFKTLVVERPLKKPVLAIIAANQRLNLKRLAQVMGDKKLALATHADAERITRLKVGGISPLALLNRGFVVVFDQSVLQNSEIFISAGQKGVNLRVGVDPLLALLDPRTADIGDSG